MLKIDNFLQLSDQDDKLPLPTLAIYTQSGSIPFLNWNFVRKFENDILYRSQKEMVGRKLVKIQLGDFINIDDKQRKSKQQLALFQKLSSLKYFCDCSFLLAIYDPVKCHPVTLKSTSSEIPIMTVQGKRMVSVKEAFLLAQTLGTEHLQVIADIHTPPVAQKKWTSKSVARSVKFFQETKKIKADTKETIELIGEKPKSNQSESMVPRIWATITGGFIAENRANCCREISEENSHNITAYIIDGFFGYKDPNTAQLYADSFEDCRTILMDSVLPNLPGHIPKALFAAFLPDDILRAIHCGISVFDTSICTVLTLKGLALPSPIIDINTRRLRFTSRATTAEASIQQNQDPNPTAVIDLNDDCFISMDKVLSADCRCYCCAKGFSRAYINHLLKRKEINASMLLQAHNHFSLTQFMDQVRQLLRTNQFEDLFASFT